MVATVCVFSAMALLGAAVAAGARSRRSFAQERLRPFREAGPAAPPVTDALEALRRRRLSNLPRFEAVLSRSAMAEKTALDLERAGIQLRVGEYLLVRVFLALAFAALSLGLLGTGFTGLVAALIFGAGGYLLPHLYVRWRREGRLNRLNKQLAEAVVQISGSLRSGFGLLQALDLVGQQLSPPISTELRRTVRDTNVGSNLEDALTALGQRVGSHDLDIVITAILIQRSVGGNLAEILDNVAHTMREREQLRGQIDALTAQQRLSAYVLVLIPLWSIGFMLLISSDYMLPMFTTTVGRLVLGVAAAFDLGALLLMRRLAVIDI